MKEKLQQSSRKSLNYRGNECLNCSHPLELSDRYCPYCGQLNSTKKISLSDYFGEFIISVVNSDSRFRYTIKDLLFKPGVITRNFTLGQRMRYANPFRFFLSVSIIYFLLSGFLDFMKINETDTNDNPSLQNIFNLNSNSESPDIPLDSIYYYKELGLKIRDKDSLKKLPFAYARESSLDTINFFKRTTRKFKLFQDFSIKTKIKSPAQAMDSLDYSKTRLNLWIYEREKSFERILDNPIEFGKYLSKKIPLFLFFLAPVFACFFLLIYFKRYPFHYILHKLRNSSNPKLRRIFTIPFIGRILLYLIAGFKKLFIVKRNYNYMEHVIFIFHIFTFLFLVLLLLLLPEYLLGGEYLSGIFITCIAPLYFYKALRNFYQESRLRTITKFFILNIVFLMLGTFAGALFFVLTAALY